MKRVLSKIILVLSICSASSHSEDIAQEKITKIQSNVEIVAIQNYANYWIYIGDKKEVFDKYLLDDEPHQIEKGYIIVSLAGISNKGYEETVSKIETNIKFTIKGKITKFLEGKFFDLECTDIIDNVPYCIVHINKETSFNQYLLMKGVSKFSDKEYIPENIKNKLKAAESYAKKNKIGVWAPFYGVFDDF